MVIQNASVNEQEMLKKKNEIQILGNIHVQ